jgi:hypothetical protein
MPFIVFIRSGSRWIIPVMDVKDVLSNNIIREGMRRKFQAFVIRRMKKVLLSNRKSN